MAHRDEGTGPCGGTCGPGARQTRPSALPPGKAGFTSRLSVDHPRLVLGDSDSPSGLEWAGCAAGSAPSRTAGWDEGRGCCSESPKRRRAGAARPLEVEL